MGPETEPTAEATTPPSDTPAVTDDVAAMPSDAVLSTAEDGAV